VGAPMGVGGSVGPYDVETGTFSSLLLGPQAINNVNPTIKTLNILFTFSPPFVIALKSNRFQISKNS
jgi:hypothetical protein